MKNLKYILSLGIISSSLLFGCEDALQTEPRQSVSAEVGLRDITGVRALLVSVYDRLQGSEFYGARLMLAPDVLADNATVANDQSNRYINFANNNFGTHFNLWPNAYAAINEANFLINGIANTEASEAEKNQIKGEALFLRALFYFDLARVYGYEPGREVAGFDKSVIIRETPTATDTDADFRERATNVQVYALIERDLTEAIALLAPATTANTRFRANKGAAQALLSRAYLYQSKWALAEQLATEAIATTNAMLIDASVTESAYRAAFATAPNPESLFEISYNASTETLGFNESLNSLTLKQNSTVLPGTGGWGDIIITPNLLNLFEPTDARREIFITDVKTGQTVTYARKYVGSRGAFTDNVPVIRLSEVYLIRAEARARQANDVLALEDLNLLRSKRFPADAPSPVVATGEDLIAAIFTERRLELFLEGHRFFDLKRTGQNIAKGGTSDIAYTDARILAPLPNAQVILNPLIEQNPGY